MNVLKEKAIIFAKVHVSHDAISKEFFEPERQ